MQVERKYPADISSGRLNADDSSFAVGANEWVNMENIRTGSTDAGVTGTMESVGSTVLLSSPSPSVSFICIGAVQDTVNDRIFYFLYNIHTPDHKIMCYNQAENRFYVVLYSIQVTGGLNFDKNYPIHSAKVIGNLLYWTDGLNPPRRINVDAALKLNDGSYITDEEPYTSPLNQSVISLIRRPPGRPVGWSDSVDPSRENFLKGFAGQFAARYIYRDGEITPFGMPSAIFNYPYDFSTFTGPNADPTNVILLEWNNPSLEGEYIDQDVRIVQFAVRYNNTNEYYVIKEWDKENSDDAQEIDDYNNNISPLAVNFYNDKSGIAVSESDSVKPYDNVPLISQAMEFATSQLYLGNNLKGYDTPKETSLGWIITRGTSGATADRMFKSYSTYQLGIRFRDNYKRQSGVVTSDDLVVNIPDRGDYQDTNITKRINWTLSNTNAVTEIPEWAYYYDLLITKCLRTRFFVQILANAVYYAIKAADGTITYVNTYSPGVYGIALGTGNLQQDGMGISFTEGDMVRLYFDGGVPAPFSLNLIDQQGGYIIARPYDIGDTSAISFLLYEYYTPYRQSGVEPFYTTGFSFMISAPGTEGRQYSTLGGQLFGEMFRTDRMAFSIPSPITYSTESMSASDDHWQDWFGIFGETNIQTLLGQEVKPTSVVWSNTIIQGTQINGLSTFEALNEKLLPLEVDAIRKLQLTSKTEDMGVIMLGICEKETASIYLGEVQTYGSNQASTLIVSDQVIGTVNILKGSYGTTNPESVSEYRGRVFWFDANRGRVIQYSVNGLDAISNYKMTRFWKQFADQYKSMTTEQIEILGGRPFIFTTIDPRHDELLISIPKLLSTPPKGYLPDYDIVSPFTQNTYYIALAFDPPVSFSKYYKGVWVYLTNVTPIGWYVFLSTEVIFNDTPPPFPDVPPEYDYSNMLFVGETLDEIIKNIQVRANIPSSYIPQPIYVADSGFTSILSNVRDYTEYPFDVWDGKGKSMVFSLKFGEGAPRWQGSYSFNPENFITLNNELYSFRNGQLYIHNDEDSYCQFYGVQYKSKIMVVGNAEAKRPKVYQNISVEANMCPTKVKMYNDYPYEQSSDLVDYDFNDKEGVFYARILRNKLQPTAGGYNQDGLLTGEKMRNVAMLFSFEFSPTTIPLELKFLNIGYDISRGHTT